MLTANSNTIQSSTDKQSKYNCDHHEQARTDFGSFNIRNFSDQLTPAKEKNKYICPVCNGHNLSIDPHTGAYQCYNQCECRQIREVVAPWNNRASHTHNRGGSPKPLVKQRIQQQLPIPVNTKLVLLGEPATDTVIPQILRPSYYNLVKLRSGINDVTTATETIYQYSPTQAVIRFDWLDPSKETGRGKTFLQTHIDSNGQTLNKKGDAPWYAYRQESVTTLAKKINGTPAILWLEGEKNVEIGRSVGLAAISPLGSNWTEAAIKTILERFQGDLAQSVHVFLTDNDSTGNKKGELFALACTKANLPFIIIPAATICQGIQEKGDIEQILENMSGDELIKLLNEQIQSAIQAGTKAEVSAQPEEPLEISEYNPNVSFNQQAVNFLYSDKPWISADDKLYCWVGDHYQYVPDSLERPKIASFCNSFCVFVKRNGKRIPTYPYATSGHIAEVLKWFKARVEVDPQILNPPGINCTNGVVEINWVGNKPIPTLKPHDYTKHYFTYEPLVKYDPHADPTYCERLLECLDKPQQEVLLRNLASSIDLPEVRKRRGRAVKLLLACGTGSNGKDSLRQVTSLIYGHHGMTSISLADFAHYDEGRKFALAALLYSRINWASENPQTMRLDKIQSLKLFATGNKLHSERKGKDFIEFNPKAPGIFNLNDVPPIQGTSQAIQDRFAALEFKKTFTDHPSPNDPSQLLADPRFAYDDDFLVTNVASAFLNKMLVALEALITEGIDYSCTKEAFKAMQKENNHLLQFCEDIGLGYTTTGTMSAMEIWNYLEQWYIDNGTLTIEDGKKMWAEQAKPSDRNIKAPNQVLARFKQLFPKAKLTTTVHKSGKKNVQVLLGIGIITQSPTPVEGISTPVPPQFPPQQTVINQDFHPTHPNEGKIQPTEKDEQVEIAGEQLTIEAEQKEPKLEWLGWSSDIASIPENSTGVELGWKEHPTGVEADSASIPEHFTQVEADSTTKTEDFTGVEVLKPLAFNLEVGNSILCYPTADHADKNKAVKATVHCVEESDGWFVGCTIEYNKYDYVTKKYQFANARIPGGCYEWIRRKL